MALGRVMALDVGSIGIGVALTDPLGYTAQPLLTIHRKNRNEDLRSITRLIRKHEIALVVVGNPLHLSGDLSPWAAEVQVFTEALHKRAQIPIELWDERLTSVAAHEILNEHGIARKDRKAIIDQVAAVLILEGWMQAHTQPAPPTASPAP